ncbi:hypothetical protein ACLOJK_040612 [Asimina triloba]
METDQMQIQKGAESAELPLEENDDGCRAVVAKKMDASGTARVRGNWVRRARDEATRLGQLQELRSKEEDEDDGKVRDKTAWLRELQRLRFEEEDEDDARLRAALLGLGALGEGRGTRAREEIGRQLIGISLVM